MIFFKGVSIRIFFFFITDLECPPFNIQANRKDASLPRVCVTKDNTFLTECFPPTTLDKTQRILDTELHSIASNTFSFQVFGHQCYLLRSKTEKNGEW